MNEAIQSTRLRAIAFKLDRLGYVSDSFYLDSLADELDAKERAVNEAVRHDERMGRHTP